MARPRGIPRARSLEDSSCHRPGEPPRFYRRLSDAPRFTANPHKYRQVRHAVTEQAGVTTTAERFAGRPIAPSAAERLQGNPEQFESQEQVRKHFSFLQHRRRRR